MYKSILINHYNTPENIKEVVSPENIIEFDYSNSEHTNIDEYISNSIISKLENKKFDIIYIKDNLSSNYLELYGLRVAYHIRLSQKLGHQKQYVPIVILSDMDGYTLNKLEPMAKIVFTKNIFLESNAVTTIDKYNKKLNEKDIEQLTKNEFSNKFLELITIEPPENSSSHSIANEWAIYKWSKELKLPQSDIIKVIAKLESQLYFKYLKAQNNIEDTIENKKTTFNYTKPNKDLVHFFANKSKILYIDDEWDKGWKDIFDFYFSSNLVQFKTLNDVIFLNHKYADIENEIIEKVFEYRPDLIILDMRLVQDDHNERIKPEDISGIKLLNKIKSTSADTQLNPGIQIIMLSASGRSDILEEANKNNKILGYIKKDHIDDKTSDTNENILKLKAFLKDGEQKFYLKKIWEIQSDILLRIKDRESLKEIGIEISIFQILNSNIENPYNFTIFTFTKCLEAISSLYINEHAMKYLDDHSDVGVYDYDKNAVYDYDGEKWYKGTENRLHNILYEKLELKNNLAHKELCELINCRNYLAHPNERQPHGCDLIKNPNYSEIIKWFDLLNKIISQIVAIRYANS
ncbi:hypothetical protein SAMN06314019_1133 [Epsilonproteobacteria bacterium SCGC AD-311-C15]|nr:hypothetical protein SAMN06314019_1133 [Epsilonproteobacteria bacterium SCGC AD-311-C15]